LFLFLFLLVTGGAVSGTREILATLAFGWLQFPRRTLPHISWNWDLVGMSLVATALILILSNWLFGRFTRTFNVAQTKEWKWEWRWTFCVFASVMLLFLVGMAVGGAAHQIGWLASSRQPWLERKGWRAEAINEMRQLDGAFQQALLESSEDLERTRRELHDPHCKYLERQAGEIPMIQKYHFLLILNGTNQVVGAILFPRNLEPRQSSDGLYTLGEQSELFPMERLPELLHKHQGQLLAL